MLTVYLVDGITRLILPNTNWSRILREDLISQGHVVVPTAENPDLVTRDAAEELRRDALLNKAL